MDVTRRDFLRGASVLAGAATFSPLAGLTGHAFGDATPDPDITRRRRLVLIELNGGNDGLNTVVPMGDAANLRRKKYEDARTATRLPVTGLHPIGSDDQGPLGLHPSLPTLAGLYGDNRVAVVQGVGYDNPNLSHFVSGDLWMSGLPTETPRSGWLGRHLDRTGVGDGELRAVAIGTGLPLLLTGATQRGAQLLSLPPAFPDGATAVHRAYRRFAEHPDTHPLRREYGRVCGSTHHLVSSTSYLTVPVGSAALPPLVTSILAARELFEHDLRATASATDDLRPLGVEVVSLQIRGFDTHADQLATHAKLLRQVDQALDAFFFGKIGTTRLTRNGEEIGELPLGLRDRTIVMTWSEFGRRIGDNKTGTDHGAAQPLFLVGPRHGEQAAGEPKLNAGLRGSHPDLTWPGGVTTRGNLDNTVDIEQVYQPLLQTWLRQPTDATPDAGDPKYAGVTPIDLFL